MAARFLGTADLDLLETLFESLRDTPFFAKDGALRYVAANPAMARLCGVRHASALYGRRAGDIFPKPLAIRYEAMDRQVLARGRGVSDKIDLSIGAGAEPVWLIFSRMPVRDHDGQVVGVIASARRLRTSETTHPTYQRLALVAGRLRDHFAEPLQLPLLAGLAGISPSQLERDFGRLFGLSPRDFLHKARIEHALRLLATNMSIAAIAYECGYADHSAFSRRFRASVGMSPRNYREVLAARDHPLFEEERGTS